MHVRVHVRLRPFGPVMLVLMMYVMGVLMTVLHKFMFVLMFVPLGQHQPRCQNHQ